MKLLIIHGPNLNLLGSREPDIYGKLTLEQINLSLNQFVLPLKDVNLEFFQSNHEGDIIDKIGEAFADQFDGIVINPAAFTHSSFAIYDAILAVDLPVIEVHLSNIYKREEFRRNSIISSSCIGIISGLGEKGYEYAISYLVYYIKSNNKYKRRRDSAN